MRPFTLAVILGLAWTPLYGETPEKDTRKDTKRPHVTKRAEPQKSSPATQPRARKHHEEAERRSVQRKERPQAQPTEPRRAGISKPSPQEERLRFEHEAAQRRYLDSQQVRPVPTQPPTPPPLAPQASQPVTKAGPAAQTVICSAFPVCSSGGTCRGVESSYGGGNVFAAGRQDIIRQCLQVNAANACCTEQCTLSARCAAR